MERRWKVSKEKAITIRISIDVAETLHALIDSSIGTSCDDDFSAEMIPVRRLLEKKIKEARKEVKP